MIQNDLFLRNRGAEKTPRWWIWHHSRYLVTKRLKQKWCQHSGATWKIVIFNIKSRAAERHHLFAWRQVCNWTGFYDGIQMQFRVVQFKTLTLYCKLRFSIRAIIFACLYRSNSNFELDTWRARVKNLKSDQSSEAKKRRQSRQSFAMISIFKDVKDLTKVRKKLDL